MGKGNRERLKRESDNFANAEVKAKKAAKAQKGVPLWAGNLILCGLGLVLLVAIVVATVSSNGLVLKLTKYASSTSYELTGTQMTYIFKTLYNNFTAQYSQYISMIINQNLSLKDQTCSFFGDDRTENNTWFDYFAEQTKAEAEQLLVLCEMAKSEGLDKLSEADEQEINDAIATMEKTALANYGMTLKGFIKSAYGAGVTEKDIATVMSYQKIASNYFEVIEDRLGDAITEDRVNKYYDEHKNDFDLVDYLTFTFTASYETPGTTASEDDKKKADEDYKADKALVDKYYALLEAVKDVDADKRVDAFRAVIVDYYMEALASDEFETAYEKEFKSIKDDLKPSEDDKKAFKTSALEKIKENLLKVSITYQPEEEDKKEETEDKKEEDKRTEVEKANDAVIASVTSTLTTKLQSGFYEGSNYVKDNENSEWYFNKDTKPFDVKATKPAEDSAGTTKKYAGTVVMLVKERYLDKNATKDVGHILISIETGKDAEAEKKANEILKEYMKGEHTKEAFEKLANENTADSGVFYEKVRKGDMVEEFENWLFDESRKDGDTGVVKTEYGYHVMYYMGTNDEAWYCDVFDVIFEDDYSAWMEDAKTKANVNINQKNINKISA